MLALPRGGESREFPRRIKSPPLDPRVDSNRDVYDFVSMRSDESGTFIFVMARLLGEALRALQTFMRSRSPTSFESLCPGPP